MPDNLVSTEWLHNRLDDPTIRILEIGSRDDREYRLGHAPGAAWAFWKTLCWDDTVRQFATPAQMAARLGDLGIGDDATIVLMSDQEQYATYAYWAMTMAGVTNTSPLEWFPDRMGHGGTATHRRGDDDAAGSPLSRRRRSVNPGRTR